MVVVDRCLTTTLARTGRGEIFEDESVGHTVLLWCRRVGLVFD